MMTSIRYYDQDDSHLPSLMKYCPIKKDWFHWQILILNYCFRNYPTTQSKGLKDFPVFLKLRYVTFGSVLLIYTLIN